MRAPSPVPSGREMHHLELPPLNPIESGTKLRRVMQLVALLPNEHKKQVRLRLENLKPQN